MSSKLGSLAVVLTLVGCGASHGTAGAVDASSGDAGAQLAYTLSVEPPNTTLAVTFGTAASVTYHAYDTRSGQKVEVTDGCAWSLADSSFGSFTAGAFTASSKGGVVQVNVVCGQGTGSTPLTVELSGSAVTAGTPSNAPTLFATATIGTDATRAPTLEYPIDQAVVPLNLPPIDSQWTVAGNDLFHLRMTSTHVSFDLYTTTADATFDSLVWSQVAASASEDSLVVTVEGLLQASPTSKFASAPVTMLMSKDTIDKTAIYYWASSLGSLLTQDFGTSTPPTVVKDNCTSCHSVSRAGTRIAYSHCSNNNCDSAHLAMGFMHLENGAWTTTLDPEGLALLGSYSTFAPVGNPFPDDTHAATLVAKNDCTLGLYDPDTATVIDSNVSTVSTHGSAMPRCATMPDWSSDGTTVVFASTPNQGQYIDVSQSSIATMSYAYTGGVHTFGEPQLILSAPITLPTGTYDNLFFPSFSPDGSYIVFNAARAAWRNSTVAGAPGQRLMLTDPTGAYTLDLAHMNGDGDLNITWPHWAPSTTSKYRWIVMSSERPYGHLLTPANSDASCKANGVSQCKQIWIGAIDTSKIDGTGADPSAPPVWLPGQSTAADNISPYWTVPPPIL